MNGDGPRCVVRVGDWVWFDGREQLVVGLAGTTVRLQDGQGSTALVLFSHLVAAEDFELLGAQPTSVPLPPFGLLDTVPGPVLARAQLWERHLIEVETGLPPDSVEDAKPRPEYASYPEAVILTKLLVSEHSRSHADYTTGFIRQ